ncbi:hypothetical protein NXC14_PA00138 (plasmid) [Rhizobium sp. NXC14]|nr:hypothetical protein NXC14_PA00138 [Rhizobium sp. NXC14]
MLLRLPAHAEIAGSMAPAAEVSRSISALKWAKIPETGRQRLTILQPNAFAL